MVAASEELDAETQAEEEEAAAADALATATKKEQQPAALETVISLTATADASIAGEDLGRGSGSESGVGVGVGVGVSASAGASAVSGKKRKRKKKQRGGSTNCSTPNLLPPPPPSPLLPTERAESDDDDDDDDDDKEAHLNPRRSILFVRRPELYSEDDDDNDADEDGGGDGGKDDVAEASEPDPASASLGRRGRRRRPRKGGGGTDKGGGVGIAGRAAAEARGGRPDFRETGPNRAGEKKSSRSISPSGHTNESNDENDESEEEPATRVVAPGVEVTNSPTSGSSGANVHGHAQKSVIVAFHHPGAEAVIVGRCTAKVLSGPGVDIGGYRLAAVSKESSVDNVSERKGGDVVRIVSSGEWTSALAMAALYPPKAGETSEATATITSTETSTTTTTTTVVELSSWTTSSSSSFVYNYNYNCPVPHRPPFSSSSSTLPIPMPKFTFSVVSRSDVRSVLSVPPQWSLAADGAIQELCTTVSLGEKEGDVDDHDDSMMGKACRERQDIAFDSDGSVADENVVVVVDGDDNKYENENKADADADAVPGRMLVCGGKSAGKSTYLRYVVNRLLSSSCYSDKVGGASEEKTASASPACDGGVAVLDCDLGQPELSPPGMITLTIVNRPLLGPPHAHMVCAGGSSGGGGASAAAAAAAAAASDGHVLAYYLGDVSSRSDPIAYVSAVKALVRRYESLVAAAVGNEGDGGGEDEGDKDDGDKDDGKDNDDKDDDDDAASNRAVGNGGKGDGSLAACPRRRRTRRCRGQKQQQQRTRRLPLVVNTDGWVKGLGYEILRSVVDVVRPKEIFQIVGSGMGKWFDLSDQPNKGRCLRTLDSVGFAPRSLAHGLNGGKRGGEGGARSGSESGLGSKVDGGVSGEGGDDDEDDIDDGEDEGNGGVGYYGPTTTMMTTTTTTTTASSPSMSAYQPHHQHQYHLPAHDASPPAQSADLRALRLATYFVGGYDDGGGDNDDDNDNNNDGDDDDDDDDNDGCSRQRQHRPLRRRRCCCCWIELEDRHLVSFGRKGIDDPNRAIARCLASALPYAVGFRSVRCDIPGLAHNVVVPGIDGDGHDDGVSDAAADVLIGSIVGLCVRRRRRFYCGDLSSNDYDEYDDDDDDDDNDGDDGEGRSTLASSSSGRRRPRIRLLRKRRTLYSSSAEDDHVPLLPCVGLGIIRSIDRVRGLFFVLTPIRPSLLRDVDVLSRGAGGVFLPTEECASRGNVGQSESWPYQSCDGGKVYGGGVGVGGEVMRSRSAPGMMSSRKL